ncbi:MAG TPA: excisionase family DNA-binding protein [Trebonia sp.]
MCGVSRETLLTRDEAAIALRTTPRFIRRLIAERRIRFVYVGRTPHIPESAIAEYIEQHTVRPVAVRWHAGKVA